MVLALAGCVPATRPDPPGLLGALIDRPPPAVRVIATGPYGNPLADPVPPVITPALADRIVAVPLRKLLGPAARLSLAQASEQAAAAKTGATLLWRSREAGGAVVPTHDVYISLRGEVCRDMQQQAETRAGPAIDPVTLCRTDEDDRRRLWLLASPD